MLSQVVTCNCVRNPGGHTESGLPRGSMRPSEEGISFCLEVVTTDGSIVQCIYTGISITALQLSKKRKKKNRTSRQTQAGIGHSAPAHRVGHVHNRIRRRQVRRGKIEDSSEAEQPRTDGGPGRQGKARQHRRVRGLQLAGAHRSQHPKKERCDKIQTPQLHVPRGHTAQGRCRVEQERNNTSRGSDNGDTTGRKRR